MNNKRYGKRVLVVITLALVWSMPSLAQVLKGSISGSLTDPQGAVVTGAEVKATQVETGAAYITQSDNSGLFRLNLLPTGHYKLEISKQGSATSTFEGVIVAAGIDGYLGSVKLGTSGEAPPTATALQGSQAQTTSLSSDTLLTNFSGIEENEGLDRQALFVPGLVNPRSNSFAANNGVPFSTNGLRGRNNDQQIDGQYNNDNIVTGPYVLITDPNFVQQYIVTNNNQGAEYGRNSGSVVNLITKSGTNAWHGNIYGSLTNTSLSALSSFQKFNLATRDVRPQNRNDEFSGFTVGGPVLKNKLFVFGGFDDEIVNTSTVFTTGALTPTPRGLTQLVPCAASLNPNAFTFLNQYGPYSFKAGNPTPLPNSITGLFTNINVAPGCTNVEFGGVTRTLPTSSHTYNTVVRADLQLGSDTITSRYLLNRSLFFNATDSPVTGWGANISNLSQDALVSWTHNLSAHMVNEARVSFGRLRVDFGGNSNGNPLEPGYKNLPDAFTDVIFNNGLSIGPGPNFPQGRIQNTWQAQDNWNYVLGKHQFKAGVNYTYQKTPQVLPDSFNGRFRFNSIPAFLTTNTPNRVQLTKGNPEMDFREHDVFLYFGDDWKISQNLTLNLGMTWSYFSQPVNL